MLSKLRAGIVLASVAMFACAAAAQDSGKGPQPGADGRIQLFNGKDLTGWVWGAGGKDTKIEDVFQVREGGVLHDKGTPAGYIRTEADYTSFILTLQVRYVRPGNSGVLIRMVGQDKVWPKSVECQGQSGALGDIWNIDQFPMKVDPKRTNGRHTVRMHPEVKEKPMGEWNDYEIVVDGSNLTLKVNGTVQNTATDVEIVPGKICLQAEGAEVEFRNIYLKPLPDKGRPAGGE